MKFKQNGIKTAVLILLAALIVVGAYFFLPTLLSGIGFLVRIFLPFILGYFVSLLINPLADRLQKKVEAAAPGECNLSDCPDGRHIGRYSDGNYLEISR